MEELYTRKGLCSYYHGTSSVFFQVPLLCTQYPMASPVRWLSDVLPVECLSVTRIEFV